VQGPPVPPSAGFSLLGLLTGPRSWPGSKKRGVLHDLGGQLAHRACRSVIMSRPIPGLDLRGLGATFQIGDPFLVARHPRYQRLDLDSQL
jgi:hypothetical protein